METLFTWVHLSDLHVQPIAAMGATDERVLSALRRDLEACAAAQPIDAILVAGDIVSSGQHEQYIEADAFLGACARACGIGPERIHVVAGNHDVDRSADRAPLTAKLVADLRQGRRRLDAALAHGRARDVLLARLDPFAVFASTFGPPPADDEALHQDLLWWSHRVEGRGGLRVRITGLCTALLSDSASDRGALRLGLQQRADALSAVEPGELVVVLSHHPARGSWLADERDVEEWLRQNAHVHLTGHSHDPVADEARAGVPGPCVWVSAGAAPVRLATGSDQRLGFALTSVVRAADGSLALRVAPRRWSAEHGRFIADTRHAPRGEAHAVHPLRLTLAPTGAGIPGQALSVHGFEGPGARPAVAAPLFADRATEMAALEALLLEPVTSVVVTGPGGVGKTALVEQWMATRAASLFEHGAWIDGRDLEREMGRACKRLGLHTAERGPRVALREALERSRLLLVIDNVAEASALPISQGPGRILILSRISTLHEDLGRGARPLRLGPWSDATCRAQLRALVPALSSEPDAALDALAQRVGRMPLGVRLLGGLLEHPEVSAASLLWRLDRDALQRLDAGATQGQSTLSSTFRPAFEALGAPERRLLLALAACAPATRAAVVAEVAGVREDEAALSLEGLSEQSLLEWERSEGPSEPGADRPFRLHAVVRLFLSGQEGAAEAMAAHERWVLGLVQGSAEARLERELAEVLAVIDRRVARGDPAGGWELLKMVLGLLERRDRRGELVATATRILGAAAVGGPIAAAVQANLGLSLVSLGELAAGRERLREALTQAEARGYRDTEALALGGLGRVHAALGELEQAVAHQRRACALHEALGMRRLHAIDLGNLGLVCRRMGSVTEAIEHLQQARAIYEELGELEGCAEVLGGLGLCFRDLGELSSAVETFQRALQLHEQLGRRAGQATMLGNLGNAYRAMGDLGKAIEHLRRTLAIYEELGVQEGLGAALGNLGACYRALGDASGAREHYERALSTFRKLGLSDEHPHVRTVMAALQR